MMEERFWSKVNKDAPNGCWEWTANVNNKGYGMFSCRQLGFKNKVTAHRISYIIANGDIPRGMHILHACDNPRCVNPSHLSAGTRSDNMTDCARKFRHKNQKVTKDMAKAIYRLYLSGVPLRDISREIGIAQCTVSDYVSGRSGHHIEERPSDAVMRAAKRSKSNAKISAKDAKDIKSRLAAGESGASISIIYGISRASVSDIKNGKTWRDVDV